MLIGACDPIVCRIHGVPPTQAAVALQKTGKYRVLYHAATIDLDREVILSRLISRFASAAGAVAASATADSGDAEGAGTPATVVDGTAVVQAVNAAMVAEPGVPIVVLFDGSNGTRSALEFQDECPGTRWINTVTQHDGDKLAVREGKEATTLLLLPLVPEACREFATQRLAMYKKALDPGIIDLLAWFVQFLVCLERHAAPHTPCAVCRVPCAAYRVPFRHVPCRCSEPTILGHRVLNR